MSRIFLIFTLMLIMQFVVAAQPDRASAQIALRKAIHHTEQQEYAKALKYSTQAIKLDSSYEKAYYQRGYIHHLQKEYRNAVIDYTRVIEIDPNNKNALLNRAAARSQLEDYFGAMRDYNKSGLGDKSTSITFMIKGIWNSMF